VLDTKEDYPYTIVASSLLLIWFASVIIRMPHVLPYEGIIVLGSCTLIIVVPKFIRKFKKRNP